MPEQKCFLLGFARIRFCPLANWQQSGYDGCETGERLMYYSVLLLVSENPCKAVDIQLLRRVNVCFRRSLLLA